MRRAAIVSGEALPVSRARRSLAVQILPRTPDLFAARESHSAIAVARCISLSHGRRKSDAATETHFGINLAGNDPASSSNELARPLQSS
ncbi:hypothetical protein [Bradyrhizobium macuxiense]|uniref:hypothetical protein n=1 Tax=Bradyrhizobium macuxiense TaxID=1755647 RepID=UPI000AF05B9F|nr:hypothetical protein [Bradyrhizobium macuxiense]